MEENLKKLKSVPFRYLMSFQNLALFQSGILGECCNTPRCTDVLGFYRIFQPDAVQRYEKLGGHGNAIAEAFIQRLSWELVKNGEGLPSSSFFLLSFQVSFLELVDLAKKALKSKVESLRLIFLLQKSPLTQGNGHVAFASLKNMRVAQSRTPHRHWL